jgi:hypothetical protein
MAEQSECVVRVSINRIKPIEGLRQKTSSHHEPNKPNVRIIRQKSVSQY